MEKDKSKKKKAKVVKPNKIIYFLFYHLVMPFMYLFYGLRIKRNIKNIETPFIAIANHESKADFLLAGLALYPHHMNFVAAMQYFCIFPLNILLKIMGAIPKCLFQPDINTVRSMIAAISAKQNVIIFPEGRTSSDGTYEGCKESINKFIKKMNVPVVNVHINGSYFFAPFWRNSIAKGNMQIDVDVLLTPQELSHLTEKEIGEVIQNALFYDEHTTQQEKKVPFKAKNPAHGLENILYLCPHCGLEFTLQTNNNMVSCNACGMNAQFTQFGSFSGTTFHSINQWYRFQETNELQKFDTPGYRLSHEVSLFMPNKSKNNIVDVGKGIISLSQEGHCYIGTKNGEHVELFFPLVCVPALPYDPGDNFQIYSQGLLYKFKPTNRRSCSQYALAGEALHNKHKLNPTTKAAEELVLLS